MNTTDHAVVTRRYPVKLDARNYQVKRLPSGALCVPVGRKNIECESGLHKFTTKIEYGLPIMVCGRCGYRAHRDMLDKTRTRRDIITTIQKGMDKEKPKLPTNPKSLDEIRKAKEKMIVELFEKHQREWKMDHGIGKEVRIDPNKR